MGIRKLGYTPKKRNSNTKKRKRIIVIATEGKNKTERLYFKQLNSDSVQIVFSKGGATDPEGLVLELKSELRSCDFTPSLGDKAYCVIDSDFEAYKNTQIANAEKKAKTKKIDMIISGPCFEIWYLCHYEYTTKEFSSNDEVIKELRKYIPNYTKSMSGIYELLLPDQAKAINGAKKLERYNMKNGKKNHTVEFRPSSEAYKIIEDIIN